MLCFTPEQAANLRYRGLGNSRLLPVELVDGRYGVSEATLTDPAFAQQRPLLKAGSSESVAIDNDNDILWMTVDGKQAYLLSPKLAHSFSIPAANTYRFECRHDEFGWSGDAPNNRHNELIADLNTYGPGDTLWTSFAFVVGPDHAPLDYSDYVGTDILHNTIFQWHSVPGAVNTSPVLTVELWQGNLEIWTRSDAVTTGPNNGKQVRYTTTRPTDGTPHYVVLQGTLGETGHLNAWIDGVQVVDVDCPIGYYSTPGEICYVDWGIYQNNFDAPTIMFHANMEWGETDLSARVASPLTVNVPPAGWV